MACVVCETAAGAGVGRAGIAPGRAKGLIAAVVSVACQRARTAGWWGRKDGWSQRGMYERTRQRTSRGREEKRSEVEAKVYVLVQEVQQWTKEGP